MRFAVIWRPAAERKLASLWITPEDRQAVTRAADDIDALLRDSPLDVGESRVSNIRILSVSPLTVYYDVHEPDLLVAVWAVWQRGETASDRPPSP